MKLFKYSLYYLSKNESMNKLAKKYGKHLGINSVVAGTNLYELEKNIKKLNNKNFSVTIDNLGEYTDSIHEIKKAKQNIIESIDIIHNKKLKGHISIKLTQLGLNIDKKLCENYVSEIVKKANEYNIFVNFDMENHSYIQDTWDILYSLQNKYNNIGTVIQSCLYRSKIDIRNNKNMTLRVVKGAYKENESVAYQSPKEIDQNFLDITKFHLLHGKFTSIATHDHIIINELKEFIIEKNIPKTKFEFQMLYGFRKELQNDLVKESFNVCIYMPYGIEWYGYFMRRLAERPKNLKLLLPKSST